VPTQGAAIYDFLSPAFHSSLTIASLTLTPVIHVSRLHALTRISFLRKLANRHLIARFLAVVYQLLIDMGPFRTIGELIRRLKIRSSNAKSKRSALMLDFDSL
jgi:hypothetical protein